jgi:hypothetical protein
MQIAMLNKGVERSKCIMPVIGNTGLVMIFGVSIVLSPSFPTYIPLSKQLDLSDHYERKVASAYLEKAVKWSNNLGMEAQSLKSSKVHLKIALDLDKYFVKIIDETVFDRGFGLFSDDRDPKDIQPGLLHMVEALNRVFANSKSRDYAEYPIAVRTPDTCINGCKFYQLVYRNLKSMGFKTGTPNRITDPQNFELYRVALCDAVHAIGEAGVIHGDLYISNVMYKMEDNEIKIKIVDWDTAHCLEEKQFVETAEMRLIDFFGDIKNVQFSVAHDKMYVDALGQELNDIDEFIWTDLASGQKNEMDSAFTTLLMKSLK